MSTWEVWRWWIGFFSDVATIILCLVVMWLIVAFAVDKWRERREAKSRLKGDKR